nr:GNAT family N-acetyltransferase [Opitutaceae bacterium]
GFTFMEHLALDPVWQSRGLGRQAVGWAMGHLARPLVLEVELPVDATSRRRIAFYERLGFRTFPETYVQPPYRVGGAFVPMRLLQGTLDGGAGLEFEAVREILRREVYRCVDA